MRDRDEKPRLSFRPLPPVLHFYTQATEEQGFNLPATAFCLVAPYCHRAAEVQELRQSSGSRILFDFDCMRKTG